MGLSSIIVGRGFISHWWQHSKPKRTFLFGQIEAKCEVVWGQLDWHLQVSADNTKPLLWKGRHMASVCQHSLEDPNRAATAVPLSLCRTHFRLWLWKKGSSENVVLSISVTTASGPLSQHLECTIVADMRLECSLSFALFFSYQFVPVLHFLSHYSGQFQSLWAVIHVWSRSRVGFFQTCVPQPLRVSALYGPPPLEMFEWKLCSANV